MFTIEDWKLLRNYRFWRLDWKIIFKSHSWIRNSNQFSWIILERIGSKLLFIFSRLVQSGHFRLKIWASHPFKLPVEKFRFCHNFKRTAFEFLTYYWGEGVRVRVFWPSRTLLIFCRQISVLIIHNISKN